MNLLIYSLQRRTHTICSQKSGKNFSRANNLSLLRLIANHRNLLSETKRWILLPLSKNLFFCILFYLFLYVAERCRFSSEEHMGQAALIHWYYEPDKAFWFILQKPVPFYKTTNYYSPHSEQYDGLSTCYPSTSNWANNMSIFKTFIKIASHVWNISLWNFQFNNFQKEYIGKTSTKLNNILYGHKKDLLQKTH